ncbi:hypothetical protein CVT30_01315 [Streptomyces sp. AMCC400023]|nr:hypothetical protein CVT30_01315 [Streptomyces sp. AMCC400023]
MVPFLLLPDPSPEVPERDAVMLERRDGRRVFTGESAGSSRAARSRPWLFRSDQLTAQAPAGGRAGDCRAAR